MGQPVANEPIRPLALDSVLTVTFRNHGRGGVVVTWVCATPAAYKDAMEEIRVSPHLEIIASGASLVYRKEK